MEIEDLIGLFLAGEASPEQAMELEDWLKESPENETYFNESARVFGYSQEEPLVDKAWKQVSEKIYQTPVRKLNLGWISSIAAVLIIAIGTIFWMNWNDETRYYSSGKKVKQVNLKDGTAIQLASNSSVKLSEEYGSKNRFLDLKGSAYFSVRHDEDLPFVIHAGPLNIKDLGTKFDVKSTEDTIYVRVDEGVVMIYDSKGMKLTLHANESASYIISNGDVKMSVKTGAKNSFSKRLSSATIILDNQRLQDHVKVLNQTYKVDIRIENAALNNCRITTEFLNEDLETVLDVIGQTLQVRIEKIDTIYWIKGTSCN